MTNCLVIGGTGFIGTHLVGKLCETNRNVRVLSNDVSYFKHSSVEYIEGDYGNIKFINKVLKGCNEVIHLAHNSLKMSIAQNLITGINENLLPTIQLLNCCEQFQEIKKIIFVSSGGTVYGIQNSVIIDETHTTEPISSYGVIKLVMEKYFKLFYYQNNLPIIILRPSNAYGPGQKPFVGQGFIATALGSVLQSKPVNIFGDGTTVRDYIYVDDLIRGIIAALEKGKPGQVYNIGSGRGYNNMQIVEQIIKPIAKNKGLNVEINFLPSRGFDVPSNVLSYQKLQSEAQWSPEVNFTEGILSTWEWLKYNYFSDVEILEK
jgi:UDP-glucose 4-epimerase